MRVLAGQERRPRRTAQGERVEVVVEGDPLVADQTPHVRQHLHFGEGLVVGLEHDDVRALRCRLRGVPVLLCANSCSSHEAQRCHHRGCEPALHPSPCVETVGPVIPVGCVSLVRGR